MGLFRRKSPEERARDAQEIVEAEKFGRLRGGASFYALSLSGYLALPDLAQEAREAIIDRFLVNVGSILRDDQNRVTDTQAELRDARKLIGAFGRKGCVENAVFANCADASVDSFNLVRAALIIEMFSGQDDIHPSLVEFFIFYCLGFSSNPVVAYACALRAATVRKAPWLTEDERLQFARLMVSRSNTTATTVRTAYDIFRRK